MEKTPEEIEKENLREEKQKRDAARRAAKKEYREKKKLDPTLDKSDFIPRKGMGGFPGTPGHGKGQEMVKKGK